MHILASSYDRGGRFSFRAYRSFTCAVPVLHGGRGGAVNMETRSHSLRPRGRCKISNLSKFCRAKPRILLLNSYKFSVFTTQRSPLSRLAANATLCTPLYRQNLGEALNPQTLRGSTVPSKSGGRGDFGNVSFSYFLLLLSHCYIKFYNK